MLSHISFLTIMIVIMTHLITLLICELRGLCGSLEKVMIATFFSVTGFLFSHWVSSGHFPLSNLYESLIFLSWALYVLHNIPKIQLTSKRAIRHEHDHVQSL
jgi:ABC-type transport system involved in cytochrome c biogenesis permease subunit